MDYKKKYKEAFERANKFYNDEGCRVGMTPIDLEVIFPELKESEDERIKKELIDFVKSRLAGFPRCEKYVTWLEKQGSQKSTNKLKFKCDDIIVDEKGEIYRVINAYDVVKDTYGLKNLIDGVFSEINIDTVDNKFHLWTIADSKKDNMIIYPSDLNNGECIFVLKETDENGVIKFNVQRRS